MLRKLCLLVLHAGTTDAADCTTPIMHALTADAMACEVEVYFIGANVRLLSAQMPHSAVSDLLGDAHANGVRIYACTSAWKAHAAAGATLAPWCAGFAGAATYLGRALDPAWRVISY